MRCAPILTTIIVAEVAGKEEAHEIGSLRSFLFGGDPTGHLLAYKLMRERCTSGEVSGK